MNRDEILLREEVWGKLLDASRLLRYFSSVHRFYARGNRLVKFGLLVSATGALAPWIEFADLPQVVTQVSASGIAVLTVVDLTFGLSDKALIANQISVAYGKLDEEWHLLWMDMQSKDVVLPSDLEEFRQRHKRLYQEGQRESEKLQQEFPWLNWLAARQAYSVERGRYATN